MPQLQDCAHWFGGDLQKSPTGDIQTVSGSERSRMRVLRRIMTVAGRYLSELGYGGGVSIMVGTVLISTSALETLIRAQMRLEPSVSQIDPISVVVTEIQGGVELLINYIGLPDKQPVALATEVLP